MSRTILKYECDKEIAENIINKFLNSYGFKKEIDSKGNNIWTTEFPGNTCFEYYIEQNNVTIYIYTKNRVTGAEKKMEKWIQAPVWRPLIGSIQEMINEFKEKSTKTYDDFNVNFSEVEKNYNAKVALSWPVLGLFLCFIEYARQVNYISIEELVVIIILIIMGLVDGIKGLKAKKKVFAILAIILSCFLLFIVSASIRINFN